MTQYDWMGTVKEFAQHVRQYRFYAARGAVALRFFDDSSAPARFIEDGPVVVGIFANDNFFTDAKARHEVQLVRQRLREVGGEELGFSVSSDGSTWAMLVGVDKDRYQTKAGKTLQRELLKTFLDDAVCRAWQCVSGDSLDGAAAASADGRSQGSTAFA